MLFTSPEGRVYGLHWESPSEARLRFSTHHPSRDTTHRSAPQQIETQQTWLLQVDLEIWMAGDVAVKPS
jgi:hypothetical protein